MSVHHELQHADDEGLAAEGHLSSPPDPLTDAVIAEIRQGHQILATELARLNAAVAAQRRPPALDATTDLSGAIVPAYSSAASQWDGADNGRLPRAGARSPDPQRVVHLGSERTPRPPERRSAIMAGAVAGGVGAVVVAVLAVLVLMPRLSTGEADAEAVAIGGLAPEVAADVAAEQPVAAPPAPVTSPAIDAVLTRAAPIRASLDPATVQLLDRLAVVQGLQGESRGEEAADVLGIGVQVARDDPDGIAAAVVEALKPEVTMEAAIALATRRPDVVGVGVAPLLDDLAAMPDVPAELAAAEAQSILDDAIAGSEDGTISGPYCNVAAHVLAPYLPTT